MKKTISKTILPAQRISHIEEYYFSRKLKEVGLLQAQGKDIISLAIGSPDLPPKMEVRQRIGATALLEHVHGYQPYTGIPELRQAFSKWYAQWYNVDINPNNEILPLIGSKEGILHISLAFLNPGDGVLVPNPGYPTYRSVSELAQAHIISYDLKEENSWMPDFDVLEQMDLSAVKLMWVNYPNMPTGQKATLELFEKLVQFGHRHQIVICNDNPYSFILNDEPISLLQIPGAKDICIEMNSMSKSHNMPGWRIGMVSSNSTFIEWILRVKSNVDSGTFRPLQIAAIEALQTEKEWHEQMNLIYKKRRIIAEQIFTTLGCRFDPQQQGMFLWGHIPSSYKNGEELADDLLYNHQIFITPGAVFGTQGDQNIRLSLCATEDKLSEALNRIQQKK